MNVETIGRVLIIISFLMLGIFVVLLFVYNNKKITYLEKHGIRTEATKKIIGVADKTTGEDESFHITEEVNYVVDGRPIKTEYTRINGKSTDKVGDIWKGEIYYDPNEPEYNSFSFPRYAKAASWISFLSFLVFIVCLITGIILGFVGSSAH